MALSYRQKLTTISLLFYWPTIFIFAHIPIPQLVRKAGVSDKSLHFLAYLILVFLLWFAISPHNKANWRKATVWWILLVTVWYGVFDEMLQYFQAGRTADVMDFFANLAGVVTGLILFTFLAFWPALLVVTGITIFTVTNLTRANLADLLPVTNVAFYLLAYTLFTMLWIHNIHLFLPLKPPQPKWLIVASTLPISLLSSAKLFSIISGKVFRLQDVIISTIGILIVIATIFLTALFRQRSAQKSSSSNS